MSIARRFSTFVVALAWTTFIPLSAYGHHSTTHFSDEFTEMEGKLVDLHWRNPHVYFFLETEEVNGDKKVWEMEAGTIYMIGRAGVTEDLFTVGETIRVAGNKSNVYEDKFWLTNVMGGDGQEILVGAGGRARWNEEAIGGRRQWTNEAFLQGDSSSASSGEGIFRVWSPVVGETPRIEGPATNRIPQIATDQALSARETWDPYAFDDACEIPGMPRINDAPHPHQFIQDGENIILIGEEFYAPRTIYMNSNIDPNSQPYSKFGFSLGRWQGENTLVIETSRIDYNRMDLSGIGQSREIKVVEKYLLSEEDGRMDYEVITTDPEMLTEPYVRRGVWMDLGETFDEFDCTPK
jgi:hypothetical protein